MKDKVRMIKILFWNYENQSTETEKNNICFRKVKCYQQYIYYEYNLFLWKKVYIEVLSLIK